ncbi:helix-turn-helix domain-containing protein [Pseudobutyrivibrio sp. LB2011]|uniref:helix-turn-helix domain-containing protein n=1 Tax=Pseudobutyrivibrio sp. LB2011 TaxID=1408312 RepID=UPI0005D1991D|nr:helix-turn-helix transcriptional regulator [Pseudobutyrivibrio sp. LB2011]
MITYDPFWKTIQTLSISQYDLEKKYGFSHGTLDSLRHNRSITMNTLDDICNRLNIDIPDVILFTPDE